MAKTYSNKNKKKKQKKSYEEEVIIRKLQILTNKHQLITTYFNKIYRAISTKRCINTNLTLFYGY
jgi:hypothetical protein